ncbi:unnamed protein product [Trichobilharzia szidati]|nr:unnamed protein product [Trichobilharzia szidati]
MGFCQRIDDCFPAKVRRWFGIVIAIFDVFLFGGYHYGFNSLVEVYKSVGLYAYNCTQEGCLYHENMFGVVFIVWMVSQMCLIVLAGVLLDKVGLRITKILATILFSAGTLMFAFTTASTVPLFYAAGILVALASICSLICNHQVSSMFPHIRGLCISLISGAYDSSTVIAFIISLTYKAFPFKWSFIILAIFAVFVGIFVALFILTRYSRDMGKYAASSKKEEVDFSENSLTGGDVPKLDIYGEISALLDERFPSLKSCVFSMPYLLINIWFTLGLFRFSFYLTHFVKHITAMFITDATLKVHLLTVSSAFFLCGFLVAPITGTIIDYFLRRARNKIEQMLILKKDSYYPNKIYYTLVGGLVPALSLMAVFAVLLSIMMFIPQYIACYAAFIFLVIVRSLLFSTFISFLLSAFPVRYFGTLNGISNALAGIISLLQYAFLETSTLVDNIVTLLISTGIFFIPIVFLILSKKN